MTKEELLDLMAPGGTEEALWLEAELFGRIMGYTPKMRVGKSRFRHFLGCVQCRFLGIFDDPDGGSYDLWYCNNDGNDVFARWSDADCRRGTNRVFSDTALKEALIRAVELRYLDLGDMVYDQNVSHITVQTLMNNLGLTTNPGRWLQSLQPQQEVPA